MKDIIIIGGGPAGLSAGLYAARSGRSCLLLEEMYSGGQITKTHNVENYPGFDEGIDGFSLAAKLEAQALRFGLELKNTSVTGLELSGPEKKVLLADGELLARTVIIATGASPRTLDIPGERELTGSGVSYCATCDGAFFCGQPVAVIGGGDTALSDALYLARFADKVYLIHRRSEFRGAKVLQDAVRAEEKIQLVLDTLPVFVEGQGSVSGLNVENKNSGKRELLAVSGLFVAVGVLPNTKLVEGKLKTDKSGYIVTDKYMRTSEAGVFAAGDVRDTPLRQVVTAAADGAVAATAAVEYLMV